MNEYEEFALEFIRTYGHPFVFAYEDEFNSALRKAFPKVSPRKITDILISKGILAMVAGRDPQIYLMEDYPKEITDKASFILSKIKREEV